jgi:Secretion system C-terminal sorting domain
MDVPSIDWKRPCRALLRSLLLALCTVICAHAQGDRREQGESPFTRVLFTGHLNFDCHNDTVVGIADEDHHYLPSAIHWGQGGAGADSACASATPKHMRARVTEFRYPRWKHITGSVSFVQMNEDTLADMVLLLWGRYEHGNTRRDSSRALLVPGQQGIDSIRTVNLESIGRFQSEPYFALELVEGTDIINPSVREFSGLKSFELKSMELDVRQRRDSLGPQVPIPVAGVAVETPVTVRLFPNPASNSTSVVAGSIAPGIYTIEVISANGQPALRREIEVASSRDLLSTIDVSDLASGYYVVRLSSREKFLGSYPIIVTR